MAKVQNSNGTARWIRWCLGILIVVLIAIASAAAANRVGVATNATRIESMGEALNRIETKLDKALGIE